MLFSVREMELFRQVMERGSVTAAATALRISQPSVSWPEAPLPPVARSRAGRGGPRFR